MDITEEMVDDISTLSRLCLTSEDKAAMAGELAGILAYMEVLNSLDTEGVVPMSHIFPVKNVMRPDSVEPSSSRECLLKNAPVPDKAAFLVPKTVE